ncbi:hypothetical protein [Sulfurimonas sp.]|uniref:hypothetical protein n=1 Tax=Sulfurimonas sp. TaxID=2022749 RepID=UPI003D100B20
MQAKNQFTEILRQNHNITKISLMPPKKYKGTIRNALRTKLSEEHFEFLGKLFSGRKDPVDISLKVIAVALREQGIILTMKSGFKEVALSVSEKLTGVQCSAVSYLTDRLKDKEYVKGCYIEHAQIKETLEDFLYKAFIPTELSLYIIEDFLLHIVYLENVVLKYTDISKKQSALKILAYLYKTGAVDLEADSNNPKAVALVDKLKEGISKVVLKPANTLQEDNEAQYKNNEGASNTNLFESSINNAYRIKYVSGKNGKHSSHCSPIQHYRKGHFRTLRNGKEQYIEGTWINKDKQVS